MPSQNDKTTKSLTSRICCGYTVGRAPWLGREAFFLCLRHNFDGLGDLNLPSNSLKFSRALTEKFKVHRDLKLQKRAYYLFRKTIMAATMEDLFGESEEDDDDDDFAAPFSEKAQKSQGAASSGKARQL